MSGSKRRCVIVLTISLLLGGGVVAVGEAITGGVAADIPAETVVVVGRLPDESEYGYWTFIVLAGIGLAGFVLFYLLPIVVLGFGYLGSRAGAPGAGFGVGLLVFESQFLLHRRLALRLCHRAILVDTNDVRVSVQRLYRLLSALPWGLCHWRYVNSAVDGLVRMGRYRDAIALPSKWSEEARELGKQRLLAFWVLAQINIAEALHNLGRDAEALELLASVEEEADAGGCRA